MVYAIELWTDCGYCAFDPTIEGEPEWLHEVNYDSCAVILVTVDESAALERSDLLSETLETTLEQFPCLGGQLHVCAYESHPMHQSESGKLEDSLRVEVPPGTHSLKVFHLTWTEPNRSEPFHIEDVLNKLAGTIMLLCVLSSLLSLLVLVAGGLGQAVQWLTGWYPIQTLGSLLRNTFLTFIFSLIASFIGLIIGNWYERIERVKQRREAAAKFRLSRPEFWLHLETRTNPDFSQITSKRPPTVA